MLGLLMVMAGTAWAATCPARLPEWIATDTRSEGRIFLVVKDAHALGVYEQDRLMACYDVTMGLAWDDGPKVRSGDRRTPEGWYEITHRNATSKYHKSVGISYPNLDDVARAEAQGIVDAPTADALRDAISRDRRPRQDTGLGGDVYVHGNPNGFVNDWTWGCVSVKNRDMDAVYRLADPGTPILIVPSLTLDETERTGF